jgi:hypothetical protein
MGACSSADDGAGTGTTAGVNTPAGTPGAPGTVGGLPPTGTTGTPGGVAGSGVGTTPPVGTGTGTGTAGAPAGTGGAGAVNMMMLPAADGEGFSSNVKIEYNDPNMKCYEFRVHAQGNKMAAWSVPTTPDLYTSFFFSAPWTGTQYVRSFRYLMGNESVIHHYLFFREATASADGSITGPKVHADGQLLQGWAPGGDDVYYSANMGQAMPPVTYLLESHHNNKTGGPAPDNTGMEVCVTTTKPELLASISWLGTDLISGTQASGTCDPPDTHPIHLVGGSPHMHTKGIQQTVVINRAGGMKEILHDKPFDFNNQIGYRLSAVINAGDTITTTCKYNAPTQFGEKTSDEMCYFFTLHYPADSLNTPGLGTFIHGPNTCGI